MESRSNKLKTSMVSTFEMVNSSKGIIERSQNALSALRFFAPMLTNLLHLEDDLRQLDASIQTGQCEVVDA